MEFTHSPFWVQIWGFPFEHMSEDTGKDIGSRLGRYVETDTRSWHFDQAKFMRVRVELMVDKPLRRGGYITSPKGARLWVTFKYERLPIICFYCGRIGHDARHCAVPIDAQSQEPQYGDWLRANDTYKGNNERSKP
ncbi:uncharacterized protein LOC115956678 [Quercus lobata]|uniref:uncharacterized protein LOC115956678 n=1 Tax=Quercus lobata TaxID=97700 RepID=UPI0012490C4C|nr:uncharacterized protein LOC115956678 [Quercus lobata]